MMFKSLVQNAAITLISLIYLILIGCTIDMNNFGTGIPLRPLQKKEVIIKLSRVNHPFLHHIKLGTTIAIKQ